MCYAAKEEKYKADLEAELEDAIMNNKAMLSCPGKMCQGRLVPADCRDTGLCKWCNHAQDYKFPACTPGMA